LNEVGDLRHDASHTLAPGEVYTLHVGAHDPKAGTAEAQAASAAKLKTLKSMEPLPNLTCDDYMAAGAAPTRSRMSRNSLQP
jgi:hypothetical protein